MKEEQQVSTRFYVCVCRSGPVKATHKYGSFIYCTFVLFSFSSFQDVSNNAKHNKDAGGERSKRHRSGVAVEKRARGQEQPPQAEEELDLDLDQAAVRRRSNRIRKSHKSSLVIVAEPAAVTTPDNRLLGNEYQYRGTVDLMDDRDKDDPSCACPYVQDMYETFREKEVMTTPRLYLSKQPQISEAMRGILVDWLVEVHLKFRLVPETLYLTVNIVDRYLSRKEVSKKNLQLVGVTSLMIAAKYEEIYPMGLDDLVYICDSAYTRSNVSDATECLTFVVSWQEMPVLICFLTFFFPIFHQCPSSLIWSIAS